MSHCFTAWHFPSPPQGLQILWRMHNYSLTVQAKQKMLHNRLLRNETLLTALPQECGHVVFTNIKSKGEHQALGSFATTATAFTAVEPGLSKSTTPLTTNKYRHAVGERHVGKMQLRETTCGDSKHGSSQYFCCKKRTKKLWCKTERHFHV